MQLYSDGDARIRLSEDVAVAQVAKVGVIVYGDGKDRLKRFCVVRSG